MVYGSQNCPHDQGVTPLTTGPADAVSIEQQIAALDNLVRFEDGERVPMIPAKVIRAAAETLRRVQRGELVPAMTHYAECYKCGAEVEFKP